tara:strand:+ start:50 stop:775 length:726 start_codon:yes stop_codon:yes gene_type:complete
MKKLLLILFLTIPYIGVGQGVNFKIGTTFMIPFSNQNDLISSSCQFCFPHKRTTGFGLQSSLSYDFHFKKINQKISISPIISYSIINYNEEETVGPLSSNKEIRDQYIDLSFNFGYKINNRLSTKIGVSIDTQIKRNINGTNIINNNTLDNEDDPVISGDIMEINYTNDLNEVTIKGLSSIISIEYNINSSIFIYTDFKIPITISDWEKNNMMERKWNDYDKKLNFQERRIMIIGIGYTIY